MRCPRTARSAAAWRSCSAAAAAGAAKKIKAALFAIAAHNLGIAAEGLEYSGGTISAKGDAKRALTWDKLVEIAHRNFHKLPSGLEPGLQAKFVWEVPTGGALPTPDGRIQMYPCYSFEAHLALVEIDPATAQPKIVRYLCGHDCGTMINPISCTHDLWRDRARDRCRAVREICVQRQRPTRQPDLHGLPYAQRAGGAGDRHRRPLHALAADRVRQKGSGEAGYLGAPAAIASAINDALAPLGQSIDELPMTPLAIWEKLQGAGTK